MLRLASSRARQAPGIGNYMSIVSRFTAPMQAETGIGPMPSTMDAIELSVFASRIQAVCDEMGAVLRRAAFSPNIKDRLDFSCAVFDARGELCAQAAHIPVHLGSMAYAMKDVVATQQWRPGDMLILNDPFLGGTHLPDVTVIAPVFSGGVPCGFVANRAHHADIGCDTPGSMPLARSLDEEGLVIAPQHILREGELDHALLDGILAALRSPVPARGDLAAQISANRCGIRRLLDLIERLGARSYAEGLAELNDYAETLARAGLRDIPAGRYRFRDLMDDDGQGRTDIPIELILEVSADGIHADFSGTAEQVAGNINCPLSVAAAGVYYVFYCLMPPQTPACAGSFRPISLHAPEGSLLNARRPAAVAAGNVETSTRVVDVVLGALAQALPGRIPAASHGSMNNVAMGNEDWTYYETLGGGMGAGPGSDGLDGVQTHMTNTLNTPIEVLEMYYPLRITRYGLRDGSGGSGEHRGGDGLIREFEFLRPTAVTVLGERRRNRPWGLAGGGPGAAAQNLLNDHPLPPKVSLNAQAGDRLTVLTAGGGGWGKPR